MNGRHPVLLMAVALVCCTMLFLACDDSSPTDPNDEHGAGSYYVNDNAQSTGEHEVHKAGCSHMPYESNSTFLGYFSDCHEAVEKAREKYSNVDGCYFCARDCHTK